MTAFEWFSQNINALPDYELYWIIEEVTNIKRAFVRFDRTDIDPLLPKLDSSVTRRKSNEPLQYIFSRAPFMEYEFYVDKRVLIPRADTEILVEKADSFIKQNKIKSILDVCAGSGAIGLSLAMMHPDLSVTLSDISPDACEVIKINAKNVNNAEIVMGDMFSGVAGRRFDMITVNPPYIPTGDISFLDEDVKKEPVLALDGGADGLDFYRRIAHEYKKYLNMGGFLLAEIGFDQAKAVSALFENSEIIKDYGGNDRVIAVRR